MIVCFCCVFHCSEHAGVCRILLYTVNNQRSAGCCCPSLLLSSFQRNQLPEKKKKKKMMVALNGSIDLPDLFEYFSSLLWDLVF